MSAKRVRGSQGAPDQTPGQMSLWEPAPKVIRYPMRHCRVANELHLRGWLQADPIVDREAANLHSMCPGTIPRTNLDGSEWTEECTCACHSTAWNPTLTKENDQ